jgi:hypothetical protein
MLSTDQGYLRAVTGQVKICESCQNLIKASIQQVVYELCSASESAMFISLAVARYLTNRLNTNIHAWLKLSLNMAVCRN